MIMPTRGRPEQALAAIDIAYSTADIASTVILPVLDVTDKKYEDYELLFLSNDIGCTSCRGTMVERSNMIAESVVKNARAKIIGWMADDTFFRTISWDTKIEDEFADSALIVQVNDGHLGEERAQSAIFMRSDVVRSLEWLCLPTQKHLYVDNAWTSLRRGIGQPYGVYLDSVIAEHMHPYINKGTWDQQYLDIHKQEQYDEDRPKYERWLNAGLDIDIRRVLSCLKS